MNAALTTIYTAIARLPGEVDVPDINPDFSAPWMAGLQIIVSYILGTALVVALGALIFALAALTIRAIPEQARGWAGDNIVKLVLGIVALGCVSGLFQWLVNFNFGF